jgi:hypothetical protein
MCSSFRMSQAFSRSVLTVVLLGVLVAPAPVAAQQDGPIYIVEEGDTLIGIAVRFGTTAEALAQVNGIADPSAIFPGVRLVLPGFDGVSGVLETRPVALGESLDSLALNYHAPPDRLAKLNRIASPSRLYGTALHRAGGRRRGLAGRCDPGPAHRDLRHHRDGRPPGSQPLDR